MKKWHAHPTNKKARIYGVRLLHTHIKPGDVRSSKRGRWEDVPDDEIDSDSLAGTDPNIHWVRPSYPQPPSK